MECTVRSSSPKVRSPRVLLATLAFVAVVPAHAGATGAPSLTDLDRAAVATGTAIPAASMFASSERDAAEPRAAGHPGTTAFDGAADAKAATGRLVADGAPPGGGTRAAAPFGAVRFAEPSAFETARSHAGGGTVLPDEVVAASGRSGPKAADVGAGGARTGERTNVDPRQPRADALPDPGSLQVFGLGLVIIATVAGTWRRRSDMSF